MQAFLAGLYHRILLGLLIILGFITPTYAAIDINNSFNAATIYPSQTSVLTIKLLNSAAVAATTTAFTNTLPTNVTVAATPNRTNNCGGTFSSTSTTLTLSGATIPASSGANPGSCLLTINVTATTKGTYVHQFNIGQVTAKNGTTTVSNTQISQGTLAVVLQDVTVGMQYMDGIGGDYKILYGNDTKFFKYTFTNSNPIALTGLSFASDVGNGDTLKLVNDGSQTNTCGGSLTLTTGAKTYITKSNLTGGTIPANGTCEYQVKLQSNRDPKLPYKWVRNNVIYVAPGAAVTTQGVSNTNSGGITVDTQSGVYLALQFDNVTNKTVNLQQYPTTPARISFLNTNTTAISGFNFTSVMPTLAPAAGAMTVQSITGNTCGGTATHNGSSISVANGTIPLVNTNAVGACYVDFIVSYTAAGTYNWIVPTGNLATYQYDAQQSTLTVTDQMLEVRMDFDKSTIFQGDELLLTYTINNFSTANPVSNIDVTNNLNTLCDAASCSDAGVRVGSKPISSTCGGTINAPANATTIQLRDIPIAAKQSCTIKVPLKVAADAFNQDVLRANTIPIGNITFDTLTTSGNIYAIVPRAEVYILGAMDITGDGFIPNTVGPLGQSRLSVILIRRTSTLNDPNSGTSNININYPFPAGHGVSSTPELFNSCGGTVTTTAGHNAFTLTNGSLPSIMNATEVRCMIAFNVKAPAMTGSNLVEDALFSAIVDPHGTYTHFSAKDNSQAAPYNQLENYIGAYTNLRRQVSSVTVNKEFLPVSINGGGKSRVRITLSNVEPTAVDLTRVSLTDAFTTGIVLHTDVNPKFTDLSGVPNASGCMGGSFTGNAGDTAITLSNASIKAKANCFFEFNVTAFKGGNHTDTIAIGDLKTFEGITNNGSPAATLTVGRQMNVANGFTPPVIAAGETTSLALSIINGNLVNHTGTATAFTTTLPAGLQVVGTPTTTCSGATVTKGTSGSSATLSLANGTFTAESTCKILANVTVATSGSYTHSIAAGSLATAAGATNSDASAALLTVIAKPTITKSFAPASIAKGGVTTLTLTVANPNAASLLPTGLTGASFTDTLTHMSIASPVALGGTCASGSYTHNAVNNGSSLVVSGLSLAPASSCTITLTITSNEQGVWTNTVSGVTSDQNKTAGTNASADLTVVQPLTVTQSFNPSTIKLGQTSRLTFTIYNPNSVSADGLPGLTDYFPTVGAGVMKLAATPNITKTCANVVLGYGDATRFAQGDDTSVLVRGDLFPALGYCSVAMDVVATGVGTYVNTSSDFTSVGGVAAVANASLLVEPNNNAPVITSNGGGAAASISQPENQTAVTTVTATDADNDILTYSITGGTDSAQFTLHASTGVLTFNTAPNYEAPTDAGANNIYEVRVSVSDGKGGTDTQDLAITITDVVELVTLQVRGLLQGAYDENLGLMRDHLRQLQLIPTTQPYTMTPFNYTGIETVSSTALTVTGNTALVDWVLVELRNAANANQVVARKAALLRRDGSIVEAATGALDLQFNGYFPGHYYIALQHRNHLAVMTATPIALTQTATLIDFTVLGTATYGLHPRLIKGMKALLWGGDANRSNQVIANGPNTDSSSVLGLIITSPLNVLVNSNYRLAGYYPTDLDMDGYTLFAGPTNDVNLLIGNVLLHSGNSSRAANYVIDSGIYHP